MKHEFKVRVYYEDTDLAGIVYYANYLKFIERARTELLRELEIDQKIMRDNLGLTFVVRRLVADYISPAFFNDMLLIKSRILSVTGARLQLEQEVSRRSNALFKANLELACVDSQGRVQRIPGIFMQIQSNQTG